MSEYKQDAGIPLQICFTRVGGQGAGSGWQVLNASPQADNGAITAFGGIQNGNVKFLDRQQFDAEDAGDRQVTELRVDGGWAFLTRIQYGLTDELGRPRLFSHGFAFPVKDITYSPDAVLAVSYGNFAFTAQATAVPPRQLTTVPVRSLRDMLNSAGLDESRYRDLVYALYSVLAGGARTSLTILCDCSEDTIRAVMGSLYAALPYALRASLTFTTYATNPGSPTTVVFAHPGRSNCMKTFDLATGQGSAISGAIRARFSKYRIASYAADHIDQDLASYYQAIDNKLSELGEENTQNLNTYNLADALLQEERTGTGYSSGATHTPQESIARLNDVIGLYMHGGATPYRDDLLARVLSEILNNRYTIPEQVSEPMCRVLSASTSPTLTALYEQYLVWMISMKLNESPLSAAQEMARLLPDRGTQAFANVRAMMMRDRRGVNVLEAYYADMIGSALHQAVADGQRGCVDVEAFAAEVKDLMALPRIAERMMDLCRLLSVDALLSCDQMTQQWLDDTILFWDKALNDDNRRIDQLYAELLQRYWTLFNFAAFDWERGFADATLYGRIATPAIPRSMVIQEFRPLYVQTVRAFVSRSATDLTTALERFCSAMSYYGQQATLSAEETDGIITQLLGLIDDIQRTQNVYSEIELNIWLILWQFLNRGSDAVSFLLNRRVNALAPDNCDDALRHLSQVNPDFYRALESEVSTQVESHNPVSPIVPALHDRFRALNKEAKKQQKRARRMEAKQERARKRAADAGEEYPYDSAAYMQNGNIGNAGNAGNAGNIPPQPPRSAQATYLPAGQNNAEQPPSFAPQSIYDDDDSHTQAGDGIKGFFGGLFGKKKR